MSDETNTKERSPATQLEDLYWTVSEEIQRMWRLVQDNPQLADHFKQRMGWIQRESSWMMDNISSEQKGK